MLGATLGWVYRLTSGRNAYHGNWSASAASQQPYHDSLASAKMSAEALRTRGTQFTIWQLPAFVVHGATHQLVIAGRQAALAECAPRLPTTVPVNLWTVAEAVSPDDRGVAWNVFMSTATEHMPEHGAYCHWTSSSVGGRYSLDWHASAVAALNCDLLLASAARFGQILQSSSRPPAA